VEPIEMGARQRRRAAERKQLKRSRRG
jgi:hypothetical protein